MQRLLAEAVAGVRGEPEVEHEGDVAAGPEAGGVDDGGAVLVGQPVRRSGCSARSCSAAWRSALQAGADEAVDVGAVVGGADGSRAGCGVRSLPARTARRSADTPSDRRVARGSAPASRRAATTASEAFAAASGSASVASGRRLAPARFDGVEQQRHRYSVVGEDGGADRPGSGHPGAVGEQQLQASVVALAGGLADGLAEVGVGSRVEQDLGRSSGLFDLHRSLQGRAVSVAAPRCWCSGWPRRRAGAGPPRPSRPLGGGRSGASGSSRRTAAAASLALSSMATAAAGSTASISRTCSASPRTAAACRL